MNENGTVTERISRPAVELTSLPDERATPVLRTNLTPGQYMRVELFVTNIDASLNGSKEDVIDLKDKITLVKNFDVETGRTTSFVFDIGLMDHSGSDAYALTSIFEESGVAGKDVNVTRVNTQ